MNIIMRCYYFIIVRCAIVINNVSMCIGEWSRIRNGFDHALDILFMPVHKREICLFYRRVVTFTSYMFAVVYYHVDGIVA